MPRVVGETSALLWYNTIVKDMYTAAQPSLQGAVIGIVSIVYTYAGYAFYVNPPHKPNMCVDPAWAHVAFVRPLRFS